MRENLKKRGEDGGMTKWLGENRRELIGIKRYPSTHNKVSSSKKFINFS
jgi:hypothetical protein